jgi:hypothetical protein
MIINYLKKNLVFELLFYFVNFYLHLMIDLLYLHIEILMYLIFYLLKENVLLAYQIQNVYIMIIEMSKFLSVSALYALYTFTL